jgi:predicted nucleic acid-binding protein
MDFRNFRIELLAFYGISNNDVKAIRQLLKDCSIIEFNNEIKLHTIQLKQKYKLKFPDAIIEATALYLNVPLLTADKSLKKIDDLNLLQINTKH